MRTESLREYCLSFPRTREKLQWGDNLCFKVGEKIFAILGLDSVPQRLCFKCAPERFEELLEREGVRPAPHLGRYKWAQIVGLDALPTEELQELIAESYQMVAAKAAKGKAANVRKTQAQGLIVPSLAFPRETVRLRLRQGRMVEQRERKNDDADSDVDVRVRERAAASGIAGRTGTRRSAGD